MGFTKQQPTGTGETPSEVKKRINGEAAEALAEQGLPTELEFYDKAGELVLTFKPIVSVKRDPKTQQVTGRIIYHCGDKQVQYGPLRDAMASMSFLPDRHQMPVPDGDTVRAMWEAKRKDNDE